MRTVKFEDRESWLAYRVGRITGTKLKDLLVKRGSGRKRGFYQLIADKLGAVSPSDENPMERGARLEKDAVDLFAKRTKKKVNTDLVMWISEDDESIAYSPDGFIGKTEAVEVKCLNSALHIETLLTKTVPSEYEEQVIQAFIVNTSLKTLYFVCYDPRLPVQEFFYLTITRKELAPKIKEYGEYERMALAEVEGIVRELKK